MLRRFLKAESGNFAVIVALAAVPLIGIMGLGIDYSAAVSARHSLQSSADAAVLAVAKESGGDLTGKVKKGLEQYGANFFYANTQHPDAKVDVKLHPDRSTVSASVALDKQLYFPFFGPSWTITAFAEAEVQKRNNACLLTLGTSGTGLSASGSAKLTAPDCTIQSNSASRPSMTTSGAASVSAGQFCTPGTGSGKFTPAVQAECPPMADPFAYLSFPSTSLPCGSDYGSYGGGYKTISPRVFCNGMWLKGTAKVTMSPGVYIIRDSELKVGSNARLQGDGVVIILQGSASFSFEAGSDVTLKAPTTGDFAGVVIAQDKTNSTAGESRVHGGGTAELTGSVYLPNQTLTVSGGGNLGVTAKQTGIVVGSFNLTGNGSAALKLNMNSDFAAAGYPSSSLAGKANIRLIQ